MLFDCVSWLLCSRLNPPSGNMYLKSLAVHSCEVYKPESSRTSLNNSGFFSLHLAKSITSVSFDLANMVNMKISVVLLVWPSTAGMKADCRICVIKKKEKKKKQHRWKQRCDAWTAWLTAWISSSRPVIAGVIQQSGGQWMEAANIKELNLALTTLFSFTESFHQPQSLMGHWSVCFTTQWSRRFDKLPGISVVMWMLFRFSWFIQFSFVLLMNLMQDWQRV